MANTESKEIRIFIPADTGPVTVNFRVGGKEAQTPRGDLVPSGQLQLSRGAEGKKLDKDYSNRNGFDAKFIKGLDLDIATMVTPRKARIAPLLDGAAGGVLDYQNFSLIMDKKRAFAMISATNIDGTSYLAIDRKTGQVGEGGFCDKSFPQ